jgi:hypothetical protein
MTHSSSSSAVTETNGPRSFLGIAATHFDRPSIAAWLEGVHLPCGVMKAAYRQRPSI